MVNRWQIANFQTGPPRLDWPNSAQWQTDFGQTDFGQVSLANQVVEAQSENRAYRKTKSEEPSRWLWSTGLGRLPSYGQSGGEMPFAAGGWHLPWR